MSSSLREMLGRVFKVMVMLSLVFSVFVLPDARGGRAYADTVPVTNAGFQQLDLHQIVQEMAYSSDGTSLFAVTLDGKLLRIRTSDLSVQEERDITGYNGSISVSQDQLYLSGWGVMQIDAKNGINVTDSVYYWDVTGGSVLRSVYDSSKLYYTTYYDGVIHVIDTVSGQRSEHNTFLNLQGVMLLSPEDHSLYYGEYGGESVKIVKLNTDDWSILATSQAYALTGKYPVLDEDSLYFQGQRLDKDTLLPITPGKSLEGETILFSNANTVITRNYAWDKYTFTKNYALPVKPKQVLELPDKKIIMLEQDGMRILKYDSIQALYDSSPDFYPPKLEISSVSFVDTDKKGGEITGTLTFNSYPGRSIDNSFTIYFLDQNLRKIGNMIAEVPLSDMVTMDYSYDFTKTIVPKEAKYIGIYIKNGYSESNTAATIEIQDDSSGDVVPPSTGGGASYGYIDYTFEDQDTLRGQVHPLVSWAISSEDQYSGYQLSFVDQSGNLLSAYDIAKHASPKVWYLIDIAPGLVPVGAMYIDLKPKELNGSITGQTVFRMQIFDSTSGSSNAPADDSLPAPAIAYANLSDYDYERGTIGGSIVWYENNEENGATAYSLYFVDANNTKLKPIANIKRERLIRSGISFPSYEVTLPTGTVIPAEAKGIGIFSSNSSGDGTRGYYFGLWDAIQADPGNIYFEDTDVRRGHINGVVHWIPVIDEQNVQKYQVQFLNGLYMPIGNVLTQVNKGQQQYEVSIQEGQIPADTQWIRVSAINQANKEYTVGTYSIFDNISGESVTTGSIDQQVFKNLSFDFTDYDGDEKEIGGLFSFVKPSLGTGEPQIIRFDAYFVDAQEQKIKPIFSTGSYELNNFNGRIPMNTRVPDGAAFIAVYPVTSAGEGRPSTAPISDRLYSATLTAGQIEIKNNKAGTSDTITLTGLRAGDTVRVYKDTQSFNPLLARTVASGSNTLTITVDQLGLEAGKLSFSLQRNAGIISNKVEKAYDAEPVTPSVPAGGGGGGAAPAKPKPVLNEEGKMTFDFKPEKVDLLISLKSDAKELELDSRTEEKVDILTVEFDSDIVQQAAVANRAIVIKSNDMLLKFAPDAIRANKSDDTIVLKLTHSPIPKEAALNGVSPVYNIELSEAGRNISSFNGTVEATFTYDSNKVKDPANVGVYVLDEQTGKWTSIGGKANGDGTITANLPHLSQYAVFEKISHAKTFGDIQGHWAQSEIEQLAAQQIIDGVDDASFKPEDQLTRAQFVTILTKALKLESKGDSKDFADVGTNSWYNKAVYAAYEEGIVSGVAEGSFAPEQNITREQLAVMMVNSYLYATHKKLSDITTSGEKLFADDANISTWAKPYVKAAVQLGLLQGYDETSFAPALDSSRAQAAVVIVRLLKNLPTE